MKTIKITLIQNFRYLFITLLSLIVLSSCKKEDNGNPEGMADRSKARVNVINTSSDAGAVRLFLNNSSATGLVKYGNSSGYYSIEPGNTDFNFKTEDDNTLVKAGGNLDANKNYTLLISKQLGKHIITTITDDLNMPATGKARIRFVNTLFNSKGISLNSGNNVLVALNDYMPTTPSSIEVTAKTYILSVSSGNYSSIPKAVTLEGGKIYTIYTMGSVSGTGRSALDMGVFNNR